MYCYALIIKDYIQWTPISISHGERWSRISC